MDKTRRIILSLEEVRQLVRQAQAGDEQAEYRLHRLCGPLTRHVRSRLRLSQELAEDWDGQVYIILHKLIEQYNPDRGVDFYTFVERVLPLDVWSWVRQNQTERQREPAYADLRARRTEGETEADAGPDDRLQAWHRASWECGADRSDVEESALLHLALATALDDLSPRRRDIVIRWQDGYACPEIAKELQISVGACQKELQRACEALRQALRKSGYRECPDPGE